MGELRVSLEPALGRIAKVNWPGSHAKRRARLGGAMQRDELEGSGRARQCSGMNWKALPCPALATCLGRVRLLSGGGGGGNGLGGAGQWT